MTYFFLSFFLSLPRCFCCWSLLYSAILRSRADSLRSHVIIIIIIDRFYIALFSALEQTHCAHAACYLEWVAVSFYISFFNIHRSGVILSGSAISLLHGWCPVKLQPSRASPVYIIQPCTTLQSHFMSSHIGGVHACLAVTCHLHSWQDDRELFTCC